MENDGYRVGEEHPDNAIPNGFDVRLPYISEIGPSVYGILEAAWLVPAILAGVNNRIWEYNPTVHKLQNVIKIWEEFGWLDGDGDSLKLSASGERLVKIAPLVDYEFSMMNQQLDRNYVTDPRKYSKLRAALAVYTEEFMPNLLRYVACLTSPGSDKKVLDFGGGDGVYLEATLHACPDAIGYLYDKAPGTRLAGNQSTEIIVADFADVTNHFQLSSLDTIIVSEVLHVLGKEKQHTVMTTLVALLKTGGKLVVIEQQPNFRLDWRMEAMTEAGACLTPSDVVALADSLSGALTKTGEQTSATHHVFVFTKV